MSQTRILIKQATVLPFTLQSSNSTDGGGDGESQVVDVLMEGDRISQVAASLDVAADQVINAADCLLMPGFVDAHTHTVNGVLERCGYEGLPLEIWMMYLPPDARFNPRLHYLSAAIAALEALKNGTTTIQDDLYEVPFVTPEIYAAVAQAYLDLGMRVNLSVHAINKPLHETIPFLENLPSDVKQAFIEATHCTPEDWTQNFRHIHREWHGKGDLVSTVLAPSGPQRVTPALMEAIAALSEEFNLPIHSHMLETRTQAVTGPEFFGESVVAYAQRHGILTHRTTVAHGIWLSPKDIRLIAEAGATVVHNPVSNYRLCSGIAPIRELMDAGVNIAIGTDGMDSFNLFTGIKAAGMMHSVLGGDYHRYPKAIEVLSWATKGGARSVMQPDLGAIAPGMKADVVLYDLNSLTFTPRYRLPIQLVYAEQGRSIRQVFVNGKRVVEDGQVLTLNEEAILAEFRELLTEYELHRELWHRQSASLRPYIDRAFSKAMATPVEVQRFSQVQTYPLSEAVTSPIAI